VCLLELSFMNLVNVVITLIALGVVLWLINTLIPMDGKIKGILNLVITIAVVMWLLRVFHLTHVLTDYKIH